MQSMMCGEVQQNEENEALSSDEECNSEESEARRTLEVGSQIGLRSRDAR